MFGGYRKLFPIGYLSSNTNFSDISFPLRQNPHAAAIFGIWSILCQYWNMFTPKAEDECTACIFAGLLGLPLISPPSPLSKCFRTTGSRGSNKFWSRIGVYAVRPRLPWLPIRLIPWFSAHCTCFDRIYSYALIPVSSTLSNWISVLHEILL